MSKASEPTLSPNGGNGDDAGHSPSPDTAMNRAEQATAERVGCAAQACSSGLPCPPVHPGPSAASPSDADGSHGTDSPIGSGRALPPRPGALGGMGSPRFSSGSATSSPRLFPRASMPSPRPGTMPPYNRRASIEELDDRGDHEYPIPEEELAALRAKRTQRNPSYAHVFPQEQWPGYRPIEEHGLIGNMHTCALVSTDAQISWYCYPHFDSPSLFASILDSTIGGHFSIRAAVEHNQFSAPNVTHRQLYHSETNVLISRFLTDSGVGQVIDYMPVGSACRAGHGWLIRELECVRGKMYFEVECEPAFNYGRDAHEVQIVTHGARFKTEKLSMVLTSSKKRLWTVTPRNGVMTKLKLVEGQKAVFIFRESKSPAAYPHEDPAKHDTTGHPATEHFTEQMKKATMEYWRNWISKCTYTGRWREAVYRSALVLKLLTFEPTGAIVAAATTSLPEGIGGTRNWDYRFSWIRDSSFVLYAFIKLGFREEAAAFMRWIAKRCEESSKGDGSLQIMYGLHGEHKLEELELDHLAGYMDSKPVRIGNGAYDQVQLDIYGELLDTVYLSNKYAEPISYEFWQHVRKMVDWVCEHWHESDEGIWEVRGGQQHFVYSKVMSWVALDRGIRLAERRSFPADLPRWQKVRNTIYEEIQERGWCKKRQAFVQHYGSETLDASVLIMPLVFFMSPTDPRFVSTLDAILASTADDGLVSNNLVFRYNVEHTQDGLVGEEGTFSICTFWAVEAAARLGMYKQKYLEKARLMFEQMLGYANHLGLYSEEIGKRGEHLGNFPQAFTHLALISAAINLDKALLFHRGGGNFLGSQSGGAPRDQGHDLIYKQQGYNGGASTGAGGAPGPSKTQGDASAVAQNATNVPVQQNLPPGIAPTARPGGASSHAVETRRDAGIETHTGGVDAPSASGEREH